MRHPLQGRSAFRGLPVFAALLFLLVGSPSAARADTLAHYRFEEGTGTDITDATSGLVDGTLVGSGVYSADTPGPIRGIDTNGFSLDFTTGGHVLINGIGFIFHSATVGGAEGDATLEWFMKVPNPYGHSAIFWSNADDNSDTNRFNIFWNADFTGAPDSDRFVEADWRDAGGAINNIGGPGYVSGHPLSLGEWHHLAIVRTDLGEGSFRWDWYLDGRKNEAQTRTTTPPPVPPGALTWFICGRQGNDGLAALIDEVRLSDRALVPEEFLLKEIPPPPVEPKGTVAFYRFEEGTGTSVVDSVSSTSHGTLDPAAKFSADTPGATLASDTNQFSADFTTGGFALMNGAAFILHTPAPGGPDKRDATLEWFMKVPAAHEHHPIFWTNGDNNDNANRFNIFWNASFTGAPDSDRFVDGDYQGPAGGGQIGAPGYNSGVPLSLNEWHHIAIVRRDLGSANDFEWQWYIDGAKSATHHATTSAELPNAAKWVICGRQGGHSLNALIDEVRLSDVALEPGKFLYLRKGGPAHYRFEEGSGAAIHDEITGKIHGTLAETATFSTDTPGPTKANAVNNSSADFTTGGYALLSGKAFIFNSPAGGGAAGDATLEWYLKVPDPQPHAAIFWTNGDTNGNRNRFNIFWNASFTGAQDSDRFIDGDFQDALANGGQIGAPGYNSGLPLELNQWNHIAIVRTDQGAGSYQWEWYLNGLKSATHTATTTAPLPDSASWLICGRQGAHALNALIDEVRLTDQALVPEEFLFTGEIPTPAKGTVAHYRFEEGAGIEVVDLLSGTKHGELQQGAAFNADTPGYTSLHAENNFSADFTTGGFALMNGLAFILNSYPGGPSRRDATLEWFIKVPAPAEHNAIFWSNADNNADDNRYNIFWNASFTQAPDSDRFVDGDFKGPGGGGAIGAPGYNSGLPLSLGEWHHLAIVRKDQGTANDFEWQWYLDGEASPTHLATTSAALPTAATWMICGRQGGHTLNALIDEVRLSDVALTPENFLFTRKPAPAYYRFEEGTGTDVVDSLSGKVHGQLTAGALFSTDTPGANVPQTGAPNTGSADFSTAGYALMTELAFVFHAPEVGGAAGDATLEWFMKVPQPAPHSAMFWSNGDNNADDNRFNIFWNASFTQAPDSDRFVDGDFKGPGGGGAIGAPGYNSGNPLSLGEWHHLAIVRTYLGTGTDFQWKWYLDGVESPTHTATTSAGMPRAVSWLIAGRSGGHAVSALFDEIRVSLEALTPNRFLNAASTGPLPPSGLTAGAANGSVNLSWSPPVGGPAVAGFNIYQTAPGAITKLNATPVVATAYTAAGLPNGVRHCFVVRSVGETGDESAPSGEACATPGAAGGFRRGDVDANGLIDVTDAIRSLGYQFLGDKKPECLDAADNDDNGILDISDAINNLNYQFLGGPPPAAPGPLNCGADPNAETPELGCDVTCN